MLDTISLRRRPGSCKEHDRVVTAICQECTVGCGLLAYLKDERIVDIQGNEHHPISRGRLCARGIAFVQGVAAPERITLPATRNRLGGPFEAFDNWEKGIDLLAERLRRAKDQHGAESLVIGCDPEAGLDFYLGALRFARLWGTPHVFHPLAEAVDPDLPDDLRRPTIESAQWAHSSCLVLIEADLAATHPVAFQRLLEAQRNGTKIIAADSRFTTTLSKADHAVLIEPNKGNELGLALMKILLAEQLDTPEAEGQLKNYEPWKDTYAQLAMESLTASVGLSADEIGTLTRAVGRHQPAALITAKRLAFLPHYGIWPTMAQAAGWHGKPGAGWYPLESGMPRLDSTIGLEEIEPEVSVDSTIAFPYQSGGSQQQYLDGLEIRAFIGSGDSLGDFLAPLYRRINDLDLTVYFGSFPNRTRQAAHMVFPAALWAERDCIGFTDEGAAQWSPRIVKPGDACRTGLGFWMQLAQRLGWEDHFPWKKANGQADQKAFYEWLFDKDPQAAELQMDQIAQGQEPVYWSRTDADRAQPELKLLAAPETVASPPAGDDPTIYPLDFQATRTSARSGATSRWWPWIRELEEDLGICIHPRVARALEIENGQTIRVVSEKETIEGPAAVSRMVPPRLVWSTQRMQADRVLVYRKGQDPEQARDRLEAMVKATEL
ncbi:MAG: molybdopterin-dependent oxidoreductase [Desulfobacteraceae bacterium]